MSRNIHYSYKYKYPTYTYKVEIEDVFTDKYVIKIDKQSYMFVIYDQFDKEKQDSIYKLF